MTDGTYKPKLALILGSGFSCEAGLPTTREIVNCFLDTPDNCPQNEMPLEGNISEILCQFWQDVFGYRSGNHKPSLEDHFTVIDLAANSGYNIGPCYTPRMLRAVRRLSIYRIFRILDKRYAGSANISQLLTRLHENFDLSVVSLNWDIVVEKHLKQSGEPFHYAIEVYDSNNTLLRHNGVPLLKMHGSSNWVYCDSCRRIFTDIYEKSALYRKVFLEVDDFKLFGKRTDRELTRENRDCCNCGSRLAGRVATFSYRKAFSLAQFQEIWDRAHTILAEATLWLFIGYSLPAADFEFMHLLKSAQMARRNGHNWSVEIVVGGTKQTLERYKSFFGLRAIRIETGGLEQWVGRRLSDYGGG